MRDVSGAAPRRSPRLIIHIGQGVHQSVHQTMVAEAPAVPACAVPCGRSTWSSSPAWVNLDLLIRGFWVRSPGAPPPTSPLTCCFACDRDLGRLLLIFDGSDMGASVQDQYTARSSGRRRGTTWARPGRRSGRDRGATWRPQAAAGAPVAVGAAGANAVPAMTAPWRSLADRSGEPGRGGQRSARRPSRARRPPAPRRRRRSPAPPPPAPPPTPADAREHQTAPLPAYRPISHVRPPPGQHERAPGNATSRRPAGRDDHPPRYRACRRSRRAHPRTLDGPNPDNPPAHPRTRYPTRTVPNCWQPTMATSAA